MNDTRLTLSDHRRDQAGLNYVYPVLSRRAHGVSIGVNLNLNRACNWACVYCQVENLRRGGPETIDLDMLEHELDAFLGQALHRDYLVQHVAEAEYRRLSDIAFSGEGEPTSAAEFPEAVARVTAVLERHQLKGRLPLRLITNGSLMHRARVRQGVKALAAAGGEIWFKIDRGDAAGMLAINKTPGNPKQVTQNLRHAASLAPTWVETCWFARHGAAPDEAAETAYLELLRQVADIIEGVHLYGLARPSHQPEAGELGRLDAATLKAWGRRIAQKTGVRVMVSP